MLVQYKNNKPFKPQIKLRRTGYSNEHWNVVYFRENCWCGSKTLCQMALPEIIAHYFSELKRTGHVVVKDAINCNR